MFLKAVALAAGMALLPTCLFSAAHKETNSVFGQIDSIVKTLSGITGLKEKHEVPYGRMSKTELRKFLNKRIKKTLKPSEIYADELSLKMFGLVPQDFDLKRSTIDLLTEQAAAFYDYDEKKLFLLDDASFSAETTTLAHELSHALADQYFNLGEYMEESPTNDDENLARTAVVEGEASWLMIAFELQQGGRAQMPTPEMVKAVAGTNEASMTDYPVLKGSPLYIQESLLFPYAEGTQFFDAVFKKMGKAAFSAVFTDPPVDSAQIIHPDRYFAHEKPTKPPLPRLDADKKIRNVTDGSMGEFDHDILLRQYLGKEKARSFSGALRGGQFKIVDLGKAKHPVLLYASQWNSEAKAAEYFSMYRRVLRSKWKHMDETSSNGDTLKGTGDNGYFEARVKGDMVTSVEGMQTPMAVIY